MQDPAQDRPVSTGADASRALTVLGGGPAGLAVAYYARRAGLDCTLFEAGPRVGGNCVTFRHGEFLFDSGAHRFHDKDAEITADVIELLGDELMRIEVPSYIHSHGRMVDFPLSPLNLLTRIKPADFSRAVVQVLSSRLSRQPAPRNFEEFALTTYGRLLADRFLLNYSEKLWGLPCARLSPDVAGARLKGLDLRTFVTEAFGGVLAKDRHVDGRFYYPRLGYGQIADALGAACGPDTIQLDSRVTRVRHDGRRITSIEVNGAQTLPAGDVVSTLPLDLFVRILDPQPPASILELSRTTRYRNVLLAAFFLDKASVSDAGTVYFPDDGFPFTRVYEPRNRSSRMAPPGKSSLVAEIPCDGSDALWRADDREVVDMVQGPLEGIGWLRADEIQGTAVRRLAFAYPVLETGYEAKVEALHRHLAPLENLRFSGRSGMFRYSWLHEMLRFGKDIVAENVQGRGGKSKEHA